MFLFFDQMTYLFFISLHIQTLFTYLFRDYLSTQYFILLFGSLIFFLSFSECLWSCSLHQQRHLSIWFYK